MIDVKVCTACWEDVENGNEMTEQMILMVVKALKDVKVDIEATTAATEKKARASVKDKARKHIDRIIKRGVVPMAFEEVLTAYAAVGILKFDEVLEMSDSYAETFISEREEQ